MSTKRKAAFKVAIPVTKQNQKRPTKFSIDETRTAVTNNASANATSEKTTVPETIEISSSSSEYEYSEEEKDELGQDQQDAPEQPAPSSQEAPNQDGDEEMADASETSPKPEDDDSDNAPTFGELVRANDPIDVPSTLTTQPSTTLVAGRPLAPPSLSSLGTVLTQALRTDDNDLLESCFSVSEINTVRNTIQRLDSLLAGALLTKLASRLHRRPGRAGTLMAWVQWTLVCHGGALAKDPDLKARLTDLQRVLKERSEGLPSLLMLKGKLDMLESQVMNRRAAVRKQKLGNEQDSDDEEDVIYVEDDEQDSEDDQMAGAGDHVPLVNGIGSDDSEEEEEDDIEEDDESNGEEVYDDDEIDHEDQDSEEEDDSDVAEAAAPPVKIQKTVGGFSKKR